MFCGSPLIGFYRVNKYVSRPELPIRTEELCHGCHKSGSSAVPGRKKQARTGLLLDIRKNKLLYVMLLPVLLYYAVFHYAPMYGAIIAFKDFSPRLGIWGSEWVGFAHFESFFSGAYFWRTIKNRF